MSLKTASAWYEVHSLSDDINLIRETHVAPWLRCNIWHVSGRDYDLLIDSGMGLRPLKKEISELMERPITCIATHAHFDHIGGQYEFETRLGHHSETEIHAAPTQENTAGWNMFVRAETFSALPFDSFDYRAFDIRAAPLTGYLDEGDVIDLGNRYFQVLHLPGHSPGSIALYEQTTRTLFSGDTVYDGELYDSVYHSDKTLYRQSLKRLRQLRVNVVHGGHNNSFDQERLVQLIDEYLAGGQTIDNPSRWIRHQIK